MPAPAATTEAETPPYVKTNRIDFTLKEGELVLQYVCTVASGERTEVIVGEFTANGMHAGFTIPTRLLKPLIRWLQYVKASAKVDGCMHHD